MMRLVQAAILVLVILLGFYLLWQLCEPLRIFLLSLSLAGAYAILIFAILELLVARRLFDRPRFNTLLMALAKIGLTETLGLLGLVLGPRLAVAIQVVSDRLTLLHNAAATEEVTPIRWEQRLKEVHELSRREPARSPELENLLDRLVNLVTQYEELVSRSTTASPPDVSREAP